MPNVTYHIGAHVEALLEEKKTTRIARVALGESLMYGSLLLIVTTACSTHTSQPTHSLPSSPVAQPSSVVEPRSTAHLVSVFHPGSVTYDLTIASLMESVSGDSIPRKDSMYLTSTVSAVFSAPASTSELHASIQVDSTRVVLTSNQVRQFGKVQYMYRIDATSGQSHRLANSPQQACGTEDINPVTGDEILPRLPVTWPQFWNDTTQFELCRAGILFRGVRIATYERKLTADSTQATEIIRQIRLTLSGRGTQWGQPVEGTGSGISVDTLLVSRTQTRVLQGSGQTQLEMKFTSQFRNQILRQTSRLKLALQR